MEGRAPASRFQIRSAPNQRDGPTIWETNHVRTIKAFERRPLMEDLAWLAAMLGLAAATFAYLRLVGTA